MTHPLTSDEIAQSSRALLSDLEASLADSQQALLSRDLTRIEQCTREQIVSHRELKILWPQNIPDPAPLAALQAIQLRVLHAVRVQAALLDRAQRWLRTLANLVAGPTANYSPSICNGKGLLPAPCLPASYLPAPYLAWSSATRSAPADPVIREDDGREIENRERKERN